MSRNGAGIYSLPAGSTVTNGDLTDATDINTPINDIAADLNIVRPVVAGGTGASTAATALAALGGQPLDGALTSLSGLTYVADRSVYSTAADTFALYTLSAAGRALIDDADVPAQRVTLGLVIGTNVQAWDADLDAVAAFSSTGIAVRTAENTWAPRTITSTGATITITNPGGVAGNINLEAVSTGRTLLATKTASASATLDFTEFNNGTYRWYEFELDNVKPATDIVDFYMRTSTNAGSTYQSGASDYAHGQTGTSAVAVATGASTGDVAIRLNTVVQIGNAATEYGVSGSLTLMGAPSAVNCTVMGHITYWNTASALVQLALAGARLAAQDTDAVRFLFSSGNLASGTIRMYGIV